VILRSAGFHRLARKLDENPSLGQHIQCLYMYFGRQYLCSGAMQTMHSILSRTSGLVQIHSIKVKASDVNSLPMMDWNMFVDMAKSSGSTLSAFHNFHIRNTALPQTPSVFDNFDRLRSLRWCSSIRFAVNDPTSPVCLATLESLHFTLYDKTFADVLCRMECVLIFFYPSNYITQGQPF
jgi:hypothetical protein